MVTPHLPLRVFAVDPATGKSGWSLLVVSSLSPLKIEIVARGVLDGQKLLKEKKDLALTFGRQFCILDALADEYVRLLGELEPDVVVSESAFGYTHMSALISLTLAIHQLRQASKQVLGKDIVTVPPTITKLAFTGKGNADKDMMRKAFAEAGYLSRDPGNTEITEHEIDAIAHGVGFIRRDLIGDVVQVSAKEKRKKKREKSQS